MAQYRFRAGKIKGGHQHDVRENVWELVAYAAANAPWNNLGEAPTGFVYKQVDGKMERVHERTGIKFRPGFKMWEDLAQQKWENHATAGGWRLDLQGIDNGWANWAIQNQGSNSKTVATCLMKVDQCFSQNQLAHGLIQSAARVQICELTQG